MRKKSTSGAEIIALGVRGLDKGLARFHHYIEYIEDMRMSELIAFSIKVILVYD